MNTFTKGDMAILKSGGPRMTVRRVEADMITCTWFETKPGGVDMFTLGAAYGELRSADFHSAMLVAIPPKTEGGEHEVG